MSESFKRQRQQREGPKALFYHWSADAEHDFMRYAKQAGFRWLNICLFGPL